MPAGCKGNEQLGLVWVGKKMREMKQLGLVWVGKKMREMKTK
jgi:hypothetical protein